MVDKMESPIKMIKQGIKDLKQKLDECYKKLAEVKATQLRDKNNVFNQKNRVKEMEGKAIQLLKAAHAGSMDTAEAEELSGGILREKEELLEDLQQKQKNLRNYEALVNTLEGKVRLLKSKIKSYENQLKTLEAREKVSKATISINRELSGVDTGGTLDMLERMKEKVEYQESLSQIYEESSEDELSPEQLADTKLKDIEKDSKNPVEELKKQLGIG